MAISSKFNSIHGYKEHPLQVYRINQNRIKTNLLWNEKEMQITNLPSTFEKNIFFPPQRISSFYSFFFLSKKLTKTKPLFFFLNKKNPIRCFLYRFHLLYRFSSPISPTKCLRTQRNVANLIHTSPVHQSPPTKLE